MGLYIVNETKLSVPRIRMYMSSDPCLKHVCVNFDNIEIRLSFFFFVTMPQDPENICFSKF